MNLLSAVRFRGVRGWWNNWNFTAAAVCLQEVAVVPVLDDHVSDHVNNCSHGNVIDHAADGVSPLTGR